MQININLRTLDTDNLIIKSLKILSRLQYKTTMDVTEEVMQNQYVSHYKATKKLIKLAGGMDTIIQSKENYNTQKLRMITEEVVHNQRITYNRVS